MFPTRTVHHLPHVCDWGRLSSVRQLAQEQSRATRTTATRTSTTTRVSRTRTQTRTTCQTARTTARRYPIPTRLMSMVTVWETPASRRRAAPARRPLRPSIPRRGRWSSCWAFSAAAGGSFGSFLLSRTGPRLHGERGDGFQDGTLLKDQARALGALSAVDEKSTKNSAGRHLRGCWRSHRALTAWVPRGIVNPIFREDEGSDRMPLR